jgi:hypothetical protein
MAPRGATATGWMCPSSCGLGVWADVVSFDWIVALSLSCHLVFPICSVPFRSVVMCCAPFPSVLFCSVLFSSFQFHLDALPAHEAVNDDDQLLQC